MMCSMSDSRKFAMNLMGALGHRGLTGTIILALAGVLGWCGTTPASDLDEFKIKRKSNFNFAQTPQFVRRGDKLTITFITEDYCDVTIAIENANGKIVRHLACGVLGPKAPAPFQLNSKRQQVVWDGKDDQGRYIDDKENYTARVSLGLKPQFEKNLLWVPQRRLGSWMGGTTSSNKPTPLIVPAPEGVYVFEGRLIDQLRLFDRGGQYLRTIYPFPANQKEKVVGLGYKNQVFEQDGIVRPRKYGFYQCTYLSSGSSSNRDSYGKSGTAATAMAVRGSRIALTMWKLNRLATDGSSGGLKLTGPKMTYPVQVSSMNRRKGTLNVSPISVAFSPDGQWLYLSGYMYRDYRTTGSDYSIKGCLHGVARINFAKNDPPEIFVGSMDKDGTGKDNKSFTDATSVACDAKGRVYVTDYMNDRIQVYAPDRTFLKTIKAYKPVRLDIHHKTGELYVYSWMLDHDFTMGFATKKKKITVVPRLTKFGSFENPRKLATFDLPLAAADARGRKRDVPTTYKGKRSWGGLEYHAVLDSWSSPPRIWVVSGQPYRVPTNQEYIRIYEERGGKLAQVYDFSEPVQEKIGKFVLPSYWRQRLYANHKNGKLYVAEQHTAAREKGFREIIEIDPQTTRSRVVQLPFDAEDMAIGPDGLFHLRDHKRVVRYDADTAKSVFREVPFDYGEEMANVTAASTAPRSTTAISGLLLYNGTGWHKGGMYVSSKGHLAISCYVTKGAIPAPVPIRSDSMLGTVQLGMDAASDFSGKDRGRVYVPMFYPGRVYFGEVHVFDRHGLGVHFDLVPGLTSLHGLGIDKDDNAFVMACPTRVLDGKRYHNELTETLMKFKPCKGRIYSMGKSAIIPMTLKPDSYPKRPPDLGKAWADGAEWFYGGVGIAGKNAHYAMGGCSCANSTFTLDYFGRSFAPELDRCQVAVLDTNGNLILRVGQYGNVDSAGKDSRVPLGGDEVGLFYAPYLGTYTDKYLWIADIGNQRIASVRLDYHTNIRQSLKDVPDRGKK